MVWLVFAYTQCPAGSGAFSSLQLKLWSEILFSLATEGLWLPCGWEAVKWVMSLPWFCAGRPVNSSNPSLKLLSCLDVQRLIYSYKSQALSSLAELWHKQTLGTLELFFMLLHLCLHFCVNNRDVQICLVSCRGCTLKKRCYLHGLNFCLIQTEISCVLIGF